MSPRGTPTFGTHTHRQELSQPSDGPEVIGTVTPSDLENRDRAGRTVTWTREDGTTIQLTEPTPPWELSDESGYALSDARRFVECPPQWRLYWINPQLLDSEGWRDWQAVMASDPRVSVRVSTMVTPEGYVRRGGPGGDILAWMWTGWYESIKLRMQQKTASMTQASVDRQQQLKEEFNKGTFGPYLHMDSATHPSHTMAEGKSMRD